MATEHEIQALLGAYRRGLFPMADPRRPGSLDWYWPDPRGVIPLTEAEGLHIPRRLRDRVRSGRFTITADAAFPAVIRACAGPRRDEPASWIDARIIDLYTGLHRAGHAHSLEAWLGAQLVGGFYGVHIGGAFFAESKFSRPALGGTDASKVCLAHLLAHLRRRGFTLLDVQFWNPHLEQFGCREIPRSRYIAALAAAVDLPVSWSRFDAGDATGSICTSRGPYSQD